MIADDDVVDAGLSTLEARAVVLARIRGGLVRPVSHHEADELLELLRVTPLRGDGGVSVLGHAESVLSRWYETVGMFLPRAGGFNPGASRVVPDRTVFLGWLADVAAMLRAADGRQCPGGSGTAVMDSIEARYELDYLRNTRAEEWRMREADNRVRRTRRRLSCKVGLCWLASLPRMVKL